MLENLIELDIRAAAAVAAGKKIIRSTLQHNHTHAHTLPKQKEIIQKIEIACTLQFHQSIE